MLKTMRWLGIGILVILLPACFKKYKIEITKEYILNEYWDHPYSSFFSIEKMKIKKDSVLDISQPGFSLDESKLETDTSFVYTYRSQDGNRMIGNKIFFNEPNKGDWMPGTLTIVKGLGGNIKTIGNLENRTWYKFSRLRSGQFYVYIYIDSVGNAHRFVQDLSNF